MKIALANPTRNLKRALRYWKPTRLTLPKNPKVCAWLWWNYSFDKNIKK
jgi:hypothetical protein